MLRKSIVLDTFRHTHHDMIYCFFALTTSKLISLWTNCQKYWNRDWSRVGSKIVRGFRSFNIVKMLLFITTFCRSSHMMIMKMTSKWDVIVNMHGWERKEILNLCFWVQSIAVHILRGVTSFERRKVRCSMCTWTFYPKWKGWKGRRYLDIRALHNGIERVVVKWMVKSQFWAKTGVSAFQRCRSSSAIVRLPLEHVKMFRTTPTPLLVHTF